LIVSSSDPEACRYVLCELDRSRLRTVIVLRSSGSREKTPEARCLGRRFRCPDARRFSQHVSKVPTSDIAAAGRAPFLFYRVTPAKHSKLATKKRGYAIKGTSEKARSKGEGSNLDGSTGIRPFAEECLKLWLSRVHPSAVPQGSMLHSYFGLWKATLDQPPQRVLPQPDQLPF
jgi:hypothetical protein